MLLHFEGERDLGLALRLDSSLGSARIISGLAIQGLLRRHGGRRRGGRALLIFCIPCRICLFQPVSYLTSDDVLLAG